MLKQAKTIADKQICLPAIAEIQRITRIIFAKTS
jgi:hypothetical protein